MNRPSAYILGTSGFTLGGAWIGSITSYVVTYWGGHLPMIQGLLNAETRRVASEIVLSNVTFGVAVALLPALAVAVLATLTFHLLGKRLTLTAFAAGCGVVGAVFSYLFARSYEAIASPVSAGAAASAICGALLFLFLSAVTSRRLERGTHDV